MTFAEITEFKIRIFRQNVFMYEQRQLFEDFFRENNAS